MRRISPVLLLIISLACFNSCINDKSESVGKKSTVKVVSLDVDIANCEEYIDLKLSDVASRFRLIQLETTDECRLVGGNDYYVGDKYILVFSNDAVFKFNVEGKFEKKLIAAGRRPGELIGVRGMSQFVVDESNDLIYIYEQFKPDVILVYDITDERFLDPVKKVFSGEMFSLLNDSVILGIRRVVGNPPYYALYFQDTDGNFLRGIENRKVFVNERGEQFPQVTAIHVSGADRFVSFSETDTLFRLEDDTLVPYLNILFNDKRSDPPLDSETKGEHSINFNDVIFPGFILFNVETVRDVVPFSAEARFIKSTVSYYVLNVNTGKVARLRSYTDDFAGTIQNVLAAGENPDALGPDFPDIQQNMKIVVGYTATEIKRIANSRLEGTAFPVKLYDRLQEINKNLSGSDNPVLLVGPVKSTL